MISKIIENYLCQQIREHLELHDLSTKNQFRFRPNRCIKYANYKAFALKKIYKPFINIMWPQGTIFLLIIFDEREQVTEHVPIYCPVPVPVPAPNLSTYEIPMHLKRQLTEDFQMKILKKHDRETWKGSLGQTCPKEATENSG